MGKGEIIELENGIKYAIAEILNYDNQIYVYLVNLANNADIRFASITKERLYFVDDEDLISELMMDVFKKNVNN